MTLILPTLCWLYYYIKYIMHLWAVIFTAKWLLYIYTPAGPLYPHLKDPSTGLLHLTVCYMSRDQSPPPDTYYGPSQPIDGRMEEQAAGRLLVFQRRIQRGGGGPGGFLGDPQTSKRGKNVKCVHTNAASLST